jgi:PAS domain S-box-containing protein
MIDARELLRRQQVLIEFGRFVLDCGHLQQILTKGCWLIADALKADLAKVLEIERDQGTALVRAGVGWGAGVVGHARVRLDERSSEAHAIRTAEPLITPDIATEDRFEFPEFMRQHGVVALVNVPILLPGREPYGVLQVDSREPRAFGEEDVQFLHGYAMVLGPVIDRLQKLRDLSATTEKYKLIIENARDYAIILTDNEDKITDWQPGAASIFGWTEDEILGQKSELLFTAEDRQAGQPQWEIDTARREGKAPNVRWHVRKDGTRVFIDGQTTALKGADGVIHGFMKIGQDVTERRQWEERQQTLVAELQHRTRNLIAVVGSVFDKTARASTDLADLHNRFRDRLDALARVQGLLSRLEGTDRVAFDELVAAQLSAMDGHGEQVTVEGPSGVKLRSSTVQILALALHELTTNAVKYGAFNQPQASLKLAWRLESKDTEGQSWLHIDWREAGVVLSPEARTTVRRGQGRELIERALPYQLDARTSYVLGADGVHCTIAIPLSTCAGSEGQV